MLVSMPMLFVNSSGVRKPDFSGYDIAMAILFGSGVLIEILADIQKALWVRRGRQGNFCEVGVWGVSRKNRCVILDSSCPCTTHLVCFDRPSKLFWRNVSDIFWRSMFLHGLMHHSDYPHLWHYFLLMYSRFQWWCLWAFSYSSSGNPLGGYADPLWWAGIVSPLFTMLILLNMQPTGISNAEGKNLKRYYDACPERYARYRENTSILIPFIGYKWVPQFLKRTIFFDFERYEYKPGESSRKDEWVKLICTDCDELAPSLVVGVGYKRWNSLTLHSTLKNGRDQWSIWGNRGAT